jgi:hypothetical protein
MLDAVGGQHLGVVGVKRLVVHLASAALDLI